MKFLFLTLKFIILNNFCDAEVIAVVDSSRLLEFLIKI